MLLGCPGVGVCLDGRFYALVRGLAVVLPDRYYTAVLCLPPADQAGAMTELHWQQVGAKEVMKHRQVLPDRLIDTHSVEHASFLPQPDGWRPCPGRSALGHVKRLGQVQLVDSQQV